MIAWLQTTACPRLARSNLNLSDVRSKWLGDTGRKWIDLDGRRMRDWPSTYDVLIEAFGLPNYFGRNLNALSECLTDHDVLQDAAFVVCITHASEVLLNANSDALDGLLDTFNIVADELAEPVSEGEPWDRPAIPFHVLLVDGGNDKRLRKYPDVDSGTDKQFDEEAQRVRP